MNITHCNDQAECLAALEILGLTGKIDPLPGRDGCDGISQLTDDAWLIITNDRGVYSMIVLDDCAKAEAWEFFDAVRKKHGWQGFPPRAVFADGKSPSVN